MSQSLSEKAKGKQRAVDDVDDLEAGGAADPPQRTFTVLFTDGLPELELTVGETDTVKDVKTRVSPSSLPIPIFILSCKTTCRFVDFDRHCNAESSASYIREGYSPITSYSTPGLLHWRSASEERWGVPTLQKNRLLWLQKEQESRSRSTVQSAQR